MDRPNRQKHLSLAQRGAIIGQHMAGISNGNIARTLNVSTATVSKWVNRYSSEHSFQRRPQPGRPKKLDIIDLNDVAERIMDTPFTNAAIIGREYGVHRDTIRSVWNDVGYFHHIAARKPRLTPAQKEERVGYALENLTRDWSNVIFSDEKTFQSDRHQRTHVYRPANTRYDERYIQPMQKSGRISAGICGWISQYGPGEMSMISGRMNSVAYIEILEENLVPTVEISFGGLQNIVYMQDNSSVHKSILTKQWIDAHNFEVLNAPVNSPDLNPIENFWAKMVYGWRSVFPRNRATLETHVVQCWEDARYDPQYFQNLYDSMPVRLRTVIDNNGAMTKY